MDSAQSGGRWRRRSVNDVRLRCLGGSQARRVRSAGSPAVPGVAVAAIYGPSGHPRSDPAAPSHLSGCRFSERGTVGRLFKLVFPQIGDLSGFPAGLTDCPDDRYNYEQRKATPMIPPPRPASWFHDEMGEHEPTTAETRDHQSRRSRAVPGWRAALAPPGLRSGQRENHRDEGSVQVALTRDGRVERIGCQTAIVAHGSIPPADGRGRRVRPPFGPRPPIVPVLAPQTCTPPNPRIDLPRKRPLRGTPGQTLGERDTSQAAALAGRWKS